MSELAMFLLGLIAGVMLAVKSLSEAITLHSEFRSCGKDYECLCKRQEIKKQQTKVEL